MLNYFPENPPSPENQRAVGATVDDVYDVKELGPGDFYDLALGGAPVTFARPGLSRFDVLVFPKAGNTTSIAFATVRRRKMWVKGNLRCRVIYSGSAGAAQAIVFGATPAPLAVGGLLSTAYSTVSASIPSVGTANALAEFVYTTFVPVDASHRVISIQLFRDAGNAADTYAGDFYVSMVLLEYIPAVREAHVV